MEAKQCAMCEFVDEFPYIFIWDEACPICSADLSFIKDIEIEEDENG